NAPTDIVTSGRSSRAPQNAAPEFGQMQQLRMAGDHSQESAPAPDSTFTALHRAVGGTAEFAVEKPLPLQSPAQRRCDRRGSVPQLGADHVEQLVGNLRTVRRFLGRCPPKTGEFAIDAPDDPASFQNPQPVLVIHDVVQIFAKGTNAIDNSRCPEDL